MNLSNVNYDSSFSIGHFFVPFFARLRVCILGGTAFLNTESADLVKAVDVMSRHMENCCWVNMEHIFYV